MSSKRAKKNEEDPELALDAYEKNTRRTDVGMKFTPGLAHSKCCNKFGLLFAVSLSIVGIIIFIGGFIASNPGGRDDNIGAHYALIIFGVVATTLAFLAMFDKIRAQRVIYYLWNLCAVSSWVFSGSVMYAEGLKAWSGSGEDSCKASSDNACGQAAAQFTGAFIYSFANMLVNIIMIFLSDLDPGEGRVSKVCNKVGLVFSIVLSLVGEVIFIGGFLASKPNKRTDDLSAQGTFLATSITSLIFASAAVSDRARARQGIYYVWNFFALSALNFAGAVMYAEGLAAFEQRNECEIHSENTCAQAGAQFAGAFIYAFAQLITNIIMIFLSDIDPTAFNNSESLE
jgi:hypothetical protein